MKSIAGIIVVAMTVGTAALAGQKTAYPDYVTKKQLYAKTDLRGKPAPQLSVEQWLTGTAPDTKGKVVVVDFWATWCGPCRHLIPEMNKWADKFKKDVVFIGISDEPAATVQGFMKETPMNYYVGVDTQKRMSKVLGVQGIPHVMIISPDGIVRWQGFPGSAEDTLTDKIISQIVAAGKK